MQSIRVLFYIYMTIWARDTMRGTVTMDSTVLRHTVTTLNS